jgi:hypothetical protein
LSFYEGVGVGVLKIEESESKVLKIEGSESKSELLCTDSTALTKAYILSSVRLLVECVKV